MAVKFKQKITVKDLLMLSNEFIKHGEGREVVFKIDGKKKTYRMQSAEIVPIENHCTVNLVKGADLKKPTAGSPESEASDALEELWRGVAETLEKMDASESGEPVDLGEMRCAAVQQAVDILRSAYGVVNTAANFGEWFKGNRFAENFEVNKRADRMFNTVDVAYLKAVRDDISQFLNDHG